MKTLIALPLFFALCGATAYADLSAVMAENNLEKRSEAAVRHAEQVLKTTRKAYDAGDMDKAQAGLSEIGEAVELAWKSLEETGKDPHKKPKYFKKAEIGTRKLLRRLDAFSREMNVADRPMLESLRKRVSGVSGGARLGVLTSQQ